MARLWDRIQVNGLLASEAGNHQRFKPPWTQEAVQVVDADAIAAYFYNAYAPWKDKARWAAGLSSWNWKMMDVVPNCAPPFDTWFVEFTPQFADDVNAGIFRRITRAGVYCVAHNIQDILAERQRTRLKALSADEARMVEEFRAAYLHFASGNEDPIQMHGKLQGPWPLRDRTPEQRQFEVWGEFSGMYPLGVERKGKGSTILAPRGEDEKNFMRAIVIADLAPVRWLIDIVLVLELEKGTITTPISSMTLPVTANGTIYNAGNTALGLRTRFMDYDWIIPGISEADAEEQDDVFQSLGWVVQDFLFTPAMLVSTFMHCRNVKRIEHVPARDEQDRYVKHLRKNRKIANPKPMVKYYTLGIEPLKAAVQREQGARVGAESTAHAMHIVAGNFATYDGSVGHRYMGNLDFHLNKETGEIGPVQTFRPMHVRGAANLGTAGAVVKDYAIKAPRSRGREVR